MSNEFYLIVVIQACIFGALTWINLILYRRLIKIESAVKLLDQSNRKLWGAIGGEKNGPQLLLD
ncbi:MAG: hypothetical protein VW683_10300 [Betaproteobacteria bacterium]|jgi:hypothetical protein